MQAPQLPTSRTTRPPGESALLQRYFAEIGHIPVLSAVDEGALARRLRESEQALRALLEPIPYTARTFVARWREISREGRVTGQLSYSHEPPAGDRSGALDRLARQLEKDLAERDARPRRGAAAQAALSRIDRRIATRVQAAELRPELLHAVLDALREYAQRLDQAPAGRGGEALRTRIAREIGLDEAGFRNTLARALEVERQGREAKDTFVRHNLRLVVHQAKGFRNYGVPFLDLIQEGTLGLIRAVEKFDERLGNRFSTYAIWWIQQSCMRSVQQSSRTVRLPSPVQDEIRRYRRTVESLATRAPSAPAASEVGRALGLETAEVDSLARLDRGAVSLDEPLPGRDDGSLGEQIVDASALSDEAVDRFQVERSVAGLLESLPSRDRDILRARYGFADGEAQTLQTVANTLGLSRERVRQLEKRALGRLAAAAREAGLESWLEGAELSE
jgi:RNA polymerase sigma factor (sigma-70 family)